MRDSQRNFTIGLATQLKVLSLSLLATLSIISNTALACSPAPSCWMKGGPDYLRSVCSGYAEDNQTLEEIARYLEEPEKIGAFGEACKKLGINIKAK